MTLTLMETILVIALASGVAASFTMHDALQVARDSSFSQIEECSFSSSLQHIAIEEQWVFNRPVIDSSVVCSAEN